METKEFNKLGNKINDLIKHLLPREQIAIYECGKLTVSFVSMSK